MSEPMEAARRRLIEARALREEAQRIAAEVTSALATASGPERDGVKSRLADAHRDFAARLADETAARRAATDAVATDLPATADRELDELQGDCPIVLLPVRLETRFRVAGSVRELQVRVYPDEIAADAHESRLTHEEWRRGVAFWEAAWRAPENGAPWRELTAAIAPARAAW